MRASSVVTHQPDDDGVVAHLGGGMQGSHPVVGPDAGLCPAVLHQVLDDFQVTLLAGQVERCGTILSLRVDNTVGKQGPRKKGELSSLLQPHLQQLLNSY